MVVHRFSGFACPEELGEMHREWFGAFDVAAADVGCKYKYADTDDVAVSFYLTRKPGNTTLAERAAGLKQALDKHYEHPNWIQDEIIQMQIGGVSQSVAVGIFDGKNVMKGVDRSGYWLFRLQDWNAKIRLSWSDQYSNEMFEKEIPELILEQVFAENWLASCTVHETRTIKEPLPEAGRDSAELAALMMATSVLLETEGAEQNHGPKPSQTQQFSLLRTASGPGCFLAKTGAAQQPFVSWKPQGQEDLSVQFVASPLPVDENGTRIISMLVPMSDNAVSSAIFVTKDKAIHLAGLYDGSIAEEQFTSIVNDIVENGYASIGAVKAGEDGFEIVFDAQKE
jgi:hypothetical protein